MKEEDVEETDLDEDLDEAWSTISARTADRVDTET